jgi:hypothetical protein
MASMIPPNGSICIRVGITNEALSFRFGAPPAIVIHPPKSKSPSASRDHPLNTSRCIQLVNMCYVLSINESMQRLGHTSLHLPEPLHGPKVFSNPTHDCDNSIEHNAIHMTKCLEVNEVKETIINRYAMYGVTGVGEVRARQIALSRLFASSLALRNCIRVLG